MALILKTNEEAEVGVDYKDKFGNVAMVDGNPVWEVSNTEVLKIVSTEDPKVVVIKATGKAGNSQISVTADADLSGGIRSIVAIQEVMVVPGEAVIASINFGSVREQAPEVVAEVVAEAVAEETAEVVAEETAEVVAEETAEVVAEETAEAVAEETAEVVAEETAEVVAEAATEEDKT